MKKKMWRCKNCRRICDISNSVCPDCYLDLGFYGEILVEEVVDDDEEEIKRKPKKRKPKKKGKRGIVIISIVVVLLALLGLGGIMSMRKLDEVYFAAARDWEHSDKYDNYYTESGSKTTQVVIAGYTGFWGPLTELTVTSSDSSVVKVVLVEEGADESNSSQYVATIRLEAGNPGTAEITAKAGNKSISYQVHVYQITGVELNVSEGLEIEEGIVLGLEKAATYTARLQYTGEVGNEKSLPKVEVASSDTDIVEVDSESGILIAKGYGTAEITASAGDYETSIPINVYDVTGVELDCYDLLVDGDGKTIFWIPEGLTMGCDFTYYYKGPNLRGIPYTLESSNERVLSVDPANFTITAVGPGEATITAAKGGFSDSVTLEVYPVDRTTGAWIKGNFKTIVVPEEGSTNKANYTITISFGEGLSAMSVPTYFGRGGSFSMTKSWEVINDQYPDEPYSIQASEGTITLQGNRWEQKRNIAGITFLLKRANAETNDYNPATDILDYWVIYTE